MKGRCCLNRSFCASRFVLTIRETRLAVALRHISPKSVSVMTEIFYFFLRKMTASIVTNDEEMKIYTDNRSINHNKSLTFPSHVVDDFIPEKIRRNIFTGIYFHILTQCKPIIGRISAFHMSHNDKILIIKHVFIAVWSISSLGPFCWQVLSDCAIPWVPRSMT